jgi:hypothetical protein
MAEITLKSFLDDDSAVKAARKKLTAASAELNKQKAALTAGGARLSGAGKEQIQKRIEAAQLAYDKTKAETDSVVASRSSYFEANKKTIRSKANAKDVSAAKQELQEVLALKQSQPNNPILDARISDLNDRINGVGKYAPKPKAKVTGKDVTPGAQEQGGEPRDYNAEITGAARTVRDLSPKDRQDLAELLKAAGYKVPITGVYNDSLVVAYQQALVANQARSVDWGEEVSWSQFLQDRINEQAAIGAAGGAGGVGKPTGALSISTPLEAAAKVEDIFQKELGRLPTPAESIEFSQKLIAEEKKTSSITKTTPKKIGGIVVNVYSGGLDKDQFLTNLVRKTPGYSEKKAAANVLNTQDLAKTALANGLDLNKNFGADVVASWVNRINNGEDIDTFKNLIRETAKVGLPENLGKIIDSGVDLDTIYAPYKRTMAAILEIPADMISLDDPTLRSAIGPDKPMTLFDFQKQLRKDARWQYTDQAREEVSSAALRVLQDFGFMG